MKILYDHQVFTFQNFGGISRYFAQIILNLPIDVQSQIAIKYSNNEYLKNIKIEPGIEKLTSPVQNFLFGYNFKGKSRLYKLLCNLNLIKGIDTVSFNKELSIELLRNQDFDIFHPTYYDDYFLDYIGQKPFVLTIHDMIHELYPEMFDDPTSTIIQKAKLARLASHIIAVSENTKSDIINILGIDEKKISVIYHSSNLNKDLNSINFKLPEEYILFVGDRTKYKNFPFFLLSIQSWIKKRKKIKIICTGHNFTTEELKLINEFGLKEYIMHIFVTEDQIYYLFHAAKALIFPSYYEGFGIPILEAFESKCPVILSNSSCFPEIAGEAAMYFESKNTNQLIMAIEKVIDNENYRNELIKKGLERKDQFSWIRSAQQTSDVYKKILTK